jgi:hypothetical protein
VGGEVFGRDAFVAAGGILDFGHTVLLDEQVDGLIYAALGGELDRS